ncbi:MULTISPECIES: hypothetical protein [Legionella]|uniref:Uncharacterized protein n=1 Tax=Legionella drozanskii LLAP-1 TaxID=1212489 RepID=A0A0W0SZ21_9GAMM|nr:MULTISPECIES: hypothetical protein [Legionella]KTC88213.1 hypothetical protein Ldro_0807 [Legionella drozanskii LLAP-1]
MSKKSYLSPQPSAVEKENKNCVKPKPTNLAGSELEGNKKEKTQKAIKRNQ